MSIEKRIRGIKRSFVEKIGASEKERKGKMKKILLVILFCVLLLVSVSASTFAADSYFGYGVEVVAKDVSIIKTGLVGKKLSFTKEDFSSGLCTDGFKSITVTAIPSSTEGTLYLGGRRVGVGRVIKT